MFHCFSVGSFFRSIGTIVSTFFCSISHRRYLITTILLILTWSISILIGILNSSHFTQDVVELVNFETYKSNLACEFDSSFKPVNYFCTIKRKESLDHNHLFSMDDIIFLVLLLVIPNFVVLLSYTWVCYHLWSHSHKFDTWSLSICMKKTFDQHEINKNVTGSSSATENRSLLLQPIEQNDIARLSRNTVNASPINIQNSHQLTIKKRNIYITLSTFLMIFCFSLCWIPFFIFPVFYSKINDTNLYNNIKVIVHFIGYSSSVINPIILITKSKRFKPKLRSIINKMSNKNSNLLQNNNNNNNNNNNATEL